MPKRIQRRRTKGWRLPEGAVIVDRTSRWGNPFKIGSLVMEPGPWNGPGCPYDGFQEPGTYTGIGMVGPYAYVIRAVRDAEDATALFRADVAFYDDIWPPEVIRRKLGGRDLACFCALPAEGEPDHCHAAVLLEIANGDPDA